MKHSIYFIFLINFFVFFIFSDCLAEKVNYLDEVYNKKPSKSDNVILDDKIITLFKDELKKNDLISQSDFEIVDIKISPQNNMAPEDNFELIVVNASLVSSNGHAAMILNLFENGKKTKSIKVMGKINILKDVFCVAFNLSKDHIIAENDIIPCRINLSDIRDNPINDISGIIGKAVKYNIPAGKVISHRILKTPIIIKRGDKVVIVSKTDNMTIKTTGEAMQDGSEGSMIRVKNVATKRDITAKVIDSNTVRAGFLR